jgi:hypothetical protein
MFENLLKITLENPILIGFIFAIIRNIGGYVVECFQAKKLLPYSGQAALKTLTLYETFFIALNGAVGVDMEITAISALAVDIIHSIKAAIESYPTK